MAESTHYVPCEYSNLETAIVSKINSLTDKKPIDLVISNVTADAFENWTEERIPRLKFNKQGVMIDGDEYTPSPVIVSKICRQLHNINRDNPINITVFLSNDVTSIKNFIGIPVSKINTDDALNYNLNLKLGNVIVKNTKNVEIAFNAFSGITARQACLENPIKVTDVRNLYYKASINVVDLKRLSNVSLTEDMLSSATLSEIDLTSVFESGNIEQFMNFGKLATEKTVIKMLPSPLVCENVKDHFNAINGLLSNLFCSSKNALYTSTEVFETIFGKNASKDRLVSVKAAYQYSYVPATSTSYGSDGEKFRKVLYKKDYEKYLDGIARCAIYLKDESTGGLINTEELVNLINDADKVDRAGDIMRGTLRMSADLIKQVYDVHKDKAFTIFSGLGEDEKNILTVDIGGEIWTQGDITGRKVFNAVWNDLVDLIVVPDDTVLEYGRCYVTDGKTYNFSKKYCQQGIIGIHSDTAGFGMGTVQGATQIHSAVAGYVLAFVDKVYPSGTPLTCGKNGTLTKMKLKDRVIHPERLVATFWKDEPQKTWNKEIQVNGRKWVKVI